MFAYAVQPHIELVGNTQCYLEGIERIEEYTEEKITLKLGKLCVTFYGDGLYIQAFTKEGASVEGTIVSMEFVSDD